MCDENQWPKDALFPDLARGRCHRSRRSYSCFGCRFTRAIHSGFRQQGRVPFNLSLSWRALGGPHAPDWPPGEVGQGGGAPRGSQPRTLFTDQVLLLAVVVRACAHNIVQVFPEEFNKIESSSIWLSYVIGIDLEGGQIGQNSHLKREFKLSIKS